MNNKDDFQDVVLSQRQNDKKEDDSKAQPIDPRSLIKSISDLQDGARCLQNSAELSTNITLTGIIRMFFYEANDDAAASYDPTNAESKKSSEEKDQNIKDGSDVINDTVPIHEPTEKEKKRLLQQLNEFVDNLSSAKFADRCSARQLQQAVAYPLAVTKFVAQGPLGQGIEGELSDIIVKVVEVLLKRKVTLITNNQKRILEPLLEEVLQRYCKESREDDFWRVIGDGVLWLVLTSSLTTIQKQKKQFELALLVGDVVQNKLLTATAIPDRVAMLANRLVNEGSSVTHIKKASMVTEAVATLEEHLECCWEQYDKTKRVFDDKIGDWLWNPYIGFARITSLSENRDQANIHVRARATDLQNVVYLNYYLNIRQLQARDAKFRSLMDKLNVSICEFGM